MTTPTQVDISGWTVQASSPYLDGNYTSSTRPAGGGGSLEYDLPISPTAVWVSTTGNDTTGDGSQSTPYATLRRAIDDVTGAGDEICIADGIYNIGDSGHADWLINDHPTANLGAIPSGNSWAASHTDRSNMFLIRAETPFGVRWNITGSPSYYENPVYLTSAQYVSIDGIIFNHESTFGENTVDIGENNYMTRCGVKRNAINDYGGWIKVLSGSLAEMCFGSGGVRYGFRSGDATNAVSDVCFRLCVARQDFSPNEQPQAAFLFYGNNSGNLATDAAFLNCIAVDGQGEGQVAIYGYTWGSFYGPKNSTNVELAGFISLNCTVYGGNAGIYGPEQSGTGYNLHDSVVWNLGDSGAGTSDGIRFDGSGTNTATRMTIGNVPDAYESAYVSTSSRLSDTLNGIQPSVLYQSDGADARYVFGSLGQRYGDAGYNVKSATPVFPYPYEDTIKSVMSETNTTPAGHYPDPNTAARGFCLDTSLTNYIITYVNSGTVIGDIY